MLHQADSQAGRDAFARARGDSLARIILRGPDRPDAAPPASDDPVAGALARRKILYVTSEMTDYVKAGGLGEVSSALPRTLRAQYDVRVMIPGYRQVLERHPDIPVVGRFPGAFGLPACDLGLIETQDGLFIYVLLSPDLYDRDGSPYGDERGVDWADNDIRFARLSLAAADLACGYGDPSWRPDVLHLNDWPSALAPAYLAWRGVPTPTILTIHNLAYQGLFGQDHMPRLGIPASAFQIDGVEFYGKLSFLKAGIYYASCVTTVSSTYAQEITRPEFGCGLDGLLRVRAHEGRLKGILNGIDESWDPSTCPHLARPFCPEKPEGSGTTPPTCARPSASPCPAAPSSPWCRASSTRRAWTSPSRPPRPSCARAGRSWSRGAARAGSRPPCAVLAQAHPGSVGVRIGFDETDARRMFAGSDFLLMPSRFEPCGLSQMYAQRFGSLPIAHRTGGLADTIEDGVTGFLFGEMSLGGFMGAIRGRSTPSGPPSAWTTCAGPP
jgi:starch synthase